MTEAEVLEKLTGIFRDVFANGALVARPDMTANDVDGWDSLSHVDMMVLVEEEFGIRFSTREVTGLKNVGDLVLLVLAKTR